MGTDVTTTTTDVPTTTTDVPTTDAPAPAPVTTNAVPAPATTTDAPAPSPVTTMATTTTAAPLRRRLNQESATAYECKCNTAATTDDAAVYETVCTDTDAECPASENQNNNQNNDDVIESPASILQVSAVFAVFSLFW